MAPIIKNGRDELRETLSAASECEGWSSCEGLTTLSSLSSAAGFAVMFLKVSPGVFTALQAQCLGGSWLSIHGYLQGTQPQILGAQRSLLMHCKTSANHQPCPLCFFLPYPQAMAEAIFVKMTLTMTTSQILMTCAPRTMLSLRQISGTSRWFLWIPRELHKSILTG